ncbi:MAG TPA: TRAP transporter small permease subunit [Burkholderiales bacterium]|jgi:TRAP-type mannitol/chloroaromatic compound transport system permease small subunit|nr:TRAP transporter small permease subunit [Burkholderiales bacterium]
MDGLLLRLSRVISALIDRIGRVVSWMVLGLVLLIAAEVLMRYGFDESSIAAQELEWWGLAIISLLGVSFTLKEGEHVRVDVLYQYYSENARLWFDFLVALLVMFPISLYLSYLSLQFVGQSYADHEVSQSPGGLPYVWVLKSFVPLGLLLLGLQSLALAMEKAAMILRKSRRANDGQ